MRMFFVQYIANTAKSEGVMRKIWEDAGLYMNGEDFFSSMSEAGEDAMKQLKASVTTPFSEKTWDPVGAERAAELAGVARTTLYNMVDRGDISPVIHHDAGGRERRKYGLDVINRVRDLQGTRPRRPDGTQAVTVCVGNLKGGSSKTVTAVHLAHAYALRGYRVLFVDMDPQASATVYFGKIPDEDVEDDELARPGLLGEVDSIESAIRGTHWDGLDIVYSNLRMVDAELNLAYMQGVDRSKRLRGIFDPVRDQYDIIIVDAPPAFGLLAINCVAASDFLLVPIRPAILDMSSSVQYWRILEWLSTTRTGASNEGEADNVRLFDCKILVTQFNTNSREAATAVALMRHLFGTTVMTAVQNTTKELENAGAQLQSIYEVRTPSGSRDTHRRAKANFDMCADEVLSSITSIWESQRLATSGAMGREVSHE